MPDSLPLPLKRSVSAQNSVDPEDVMVVKRSLQRLDFYEPWDGELNSFTDRQLFDGIKSFQQAQGLAVDGVMNPDGETAGEIGRLLASNTPVPAGDQTAINVDKPSEAQCDHLYWNIDIPTCQRIQAR